MLPLALPACLNARIEKKPPMMHEVIRYGVVDSQGDIFAHGCFGNVEGWRLAVTLDFNHRSIVGMATLHLAPHALVAELDPGVQERAGFKDLPFELAAAFHGTGEPYPHDWSSSRHFKKLHIMELAIVAPGKKIK
jgi:hypothetical protein